MNRRNIGVTLEANPGPLRRGLLQGGGYVRQFGQDVNRVARDTHVNTNQIGRAFTVMGAVIAGALALSLNSFIGFEREMRNVATISQYTRDNMASVSQELFTMSSRLPQSATTLAKGLYDVASSGFAGREGIHVLDIAAQGASAGLTDTATSARALTAVLNAYGLQAKDARDVSDILFQTVNLGVVTYEELAGQIGDVIGMAAAAKIPIKDVGTAIATMTLSGINAAESTTSLNRVIQSILDPSDELDDVLTSLGYTSGEMALQQDGLQKVMTRVRQETGGSVTAFLALFPEIRAARGALALTSAEGANWARVAAGMNDATKGVGATQRALNEQSKGLGFQLQLLRNQITNVAITFGSVLAPPVRFITNQLKTLVAGVQALPGPLRAVLVVAALLAATTLTLGGAFLMLAPRIVATQAAMTALGVSSGFAAAGLKALVVSLGVIGIALTLTAVLLGRARDAQDQLNQRAQQYLDILRETNGVLGKNADTQIRRNLAQKDAIKLGKDLGATADLLVKAARDEDAAKKVAQITGDKILKQAGLEGRQRELLKRALDGNSSAYIELSNSNVKNWFATRQNLDARRDLLSMLSGEYAAVKRSKEIYDQETPGKKKSAAASRESAAAANQERAMIAQLGGQLDAASGKTTKLTSLQGALQESFAKIISPADAYQVAVNKVAERTGEDLGKASDSWWDFSRSATHSLDEFVGQLNAQNSAIAGWQANLITIAARGGREFVGQLMAMGPAAAGLVQEIATSTPEQFEAVRQAFGESGRLASAEVAKEFDEGLKLASQAASEGGASAGRDLDSALRREMPKAAETVRTYVNIINGYLSQIRAAKATAQANANAATRQALLEQGIDPSIFGLANGGIMRFADGGHIAQIAPAGAWRVWAEPETGGEAYIPLAQGKRARSTKILEQVAGMFGYRLMKMDVGGLIAQAAARQNAINNIAGTWTNPSIQAARDQAFADRWNGSQMDQAAWDAAQEAAWRAADQVANLYQDVVDTAGDAAAQQLINSGLTGPALQDAARRIMDAARDQADAQRQAAEDAKRAAEEAQRAAEEAARARQQAIEEAKRQAKEIFDSYVAPFKQQASIVGAFGGTGGGAAPTLANIQDFFAHQITGATRFASATDQLKKLGLDPTLLDELIKSGPQSLMLAEALLSGGAAGVAGINAQQKQIDTIAQGVAKAFTPDYRQLLEPQTATVTVGDISVQITAPIGGTITPDDIRQQIDRSMRMVVKEIRRGVRR